MKTYKFKTNAKCGGCTTKIDAALKNNPESGSWTFDLQDPNKVLTITTELPAEKVVKIVNEAGYKAEEL
ncbi:MAG: cation transporter [Bacteroidales bacterium]